MIVKNHLALYHSVIGVEYHSVNLAYPVEHAVLLDVAVVVLGDFVFICEGQGSTKLPT